MGNIVLLDDLTINKIAAGEVIERPASVVKELLENSIDAGSKNITIEIKNGGISMIKITDDGSGIAEDDMEIAFERHATSKIRRAEDLAFVTSMGFRGEALASIAAISKVEMISKKSNSDVAHKIVVEGGKTIDFCETARNVGTTITVENLFYNTPVRYKFLKKDYTEAGYIEDVVNRTALVNLDIAIKLISNGKTILQTSGNGDINKVIYSIYGKDTAIETVDVDYEYEEIRVRGVVGNPVIARSNRSNQLFFLNGRYIKDKNITAAVDQAFKGIVPVGRYGFAILNLQMDPKTVDVNVHPAKLEVRFEDESRVFKAVYHAIKSCLTDVNNSDAVKQDTFDFMNSFNQNKKDFKYGNTSPAGFKKSKYEYSYNDDKWANKYSADSFKVNNSFNDSKFDTNNLGDDKKSSGLVGLFKKIIKEPDETEDELNNNYLADIYKSNYGLGEGTEITSKDINLNNNSLKSSNIVNNDLNSNIQKTVNEDLLNKSIMLGDALISSNTMQINVEENRNNANNSNIADNVNVNNDDINSSNSIIQTVVSNDNEIKSQEINNTIEDDNSLTNEAFKRVILNSSNSNTQEIEYNSKIDDTQIVGTVHNFLKDKNIDDNTGEIEIIEKTEENVNKVETDNDDVNEDKVETETSSININENPNIAELTENDIKENTSEVEITENDIKENTSEVELTENDIKENTSEVELTENDVKENTSEVKLTENELNDNTNEVNLNEIKISGNVEGIDTEEETSNNIEINNDEFNKEQNSNSFDKIASGIIEAKMQTDSTQTIDTDKVREALNETSEETKPEFEEMYKKTFGIETFSQRKEKELENLEKQKTDMSNDFDFVYSNNLNVFDDEENYKIPYKYIGIVFDNFIIIEIKDEIFIVNHVSANGKIIFEQLVNNYYNNETIDENQFLLLPDIVPLTDKEFALARENAEMFAKAGFIFEEFGDKTIKLVSVPSICEKLNTKQLFTDILNELDKVAITAKDEKANIFLATIADKVSSRISERLDNDIARSLIDDLLCLKEPFGDLLGKPIAIKMTRSDLEKKFSRK